MIMHDCDNCGTSEERVFTDSWTRMSLCLGCIGSVAWRVTNSPATEGDNLKEELDLIS